MIVEPKIYIVNNKQYTIRSADLSDAKSISKLRIVIDGEIENLDRVSGEGIIDEIGFKKIIKNDTEKLRNLFLVAVVAGEIVAFCRCEGSELKRLQHNVEFGICVLKSNWG